MREWATLFDSDLQTLLGLDSESFQDPRARLYLPILIAYFSGDLETLERLADKAHVQPVALLARLRLGIRRNQVDLAQVREAENLILEVESFWKGELHFVLSSAEAVLERHEQARDHSLRAFHALKKIGAKKKAVRSLMNAVSSESCRRPEKHYFADLHFLYSEAKKIDDSITQGVTQLNISREYQKLGLFHAALKSASRAILALSRVTGGIDFSLALAHRAHVYCQLGAWTEARLDAERACAAPFPETKAAIEIIQRDFPLLSQIPAPAVHAMPRSAIPAWRKREHESIASPASKLEEKLIRILTRRPHSREQICERLYGDRLAPEVTRNRFNNLLNRVRKRHPALITLSAGRYRLAESPVLPKLQVKR